MNKIHFVVCAFCFCFTNHAQVKICDSLYFSGNYKAAEKIYLREPDLETNPVSLNRLGFCFHNSDQYDKALEYYLKAEKLSTNKVLSFTIQARLARIYTRLNETEKSNIWLRKAVANGYSNIAELNTNADFNNIRKLKSFISLYDSLENIVFPCKKEVERRQFDFWLGSWDVFTTNGNQPAGQSSINYCSEGCMILENYTGVTGYTGKSMNYLNEKKEWEQTWMGSDGKVMRFNHGAFAGGEMLFSFETSDQAGNKKIGKFHFYKVDDHTVRQMQESSSDNGKTYTIDYDLTYKRKKTE